MSYKNLLSLRCLLRDSGTDRLLPSHLFIIHLKLSEPTNRRVSAGKFDRDKPKQTAKQPNGCDITSRSTLITPEEGIVGPFSIRETIEIHPLKLLIFRRNLIVLRRRNRI